MKALKSARTLAASLGVLAIGAMAASPAVAFDDVDWDWYKDVNERVDIYVKINIDQYPTGLVEVEKLQIFLGDVTAYNHVSHIYNNPLYPEADKKYTPYGVYTDDWYEHNPNGGYDPIIVIGPFCGYSINVLSCNNIFIDTNHYSDNWDKVPIKPLDARTELPIILASATAVGNNQSITADVPIFLHDGQFVANVKDGGDCRSWCDLYAGLPTNAGGDDYDGNLHHTVALVFGLLAITNNLDHAEISAYSQVDYVYNVSVDNSSTAVANNISVNLASDNPENHVVIADITQFALANVTAQTYTHNVYATGYSHMRELTTPTLTPTDANPNQIVNVPTPWISSTATAVGNNVSINVGPVLAE